MAKYIKNVQELYNLYKRWISENPQVVGDVETMVKWMSYLVAGRITTSPAVSELIYSLSNLLVLFNDQIIQKTRTVGYGAANQNIPKAESKLKLFLTTLEYIEVFIEYSAKRLWNEQGRWFFIVLVQLTKFVGRCVLILQFNHKFVSNPPIQTLERKKLDQSSNNEESEGFVNPTGSFSFTLKRSGRVVRKVEGAPPVYLRNWKNSPVAESSSNDFLTSGSDTDVSRIAELVYIVKPLIHLGSVSLFGYSSWKSWGSSLVLDLLSLRLYYTNRSSMTKDQRVEVSRRCVSLLLYLMRSPFYDRYTGVKINALLNAISHTIPFSKTVCNPIGDYIPQWQSTYFYMWST